MSILDEIVKRRRAAFKARLPKLRSWLVEQLGRVERPRPFHQAIMSPARWALIAEIKARSPSRGTLVENPDPGLWASRYERAGAAALSVVTEEDYFRGRPEWIGAAKKASRLPVLRKDFLTTREEILESCALGADAVLLIAAILDEKLLGALVAQTLDLGMEPLVEVHTREEVDKALRTRARLIGINNRNLHDFSVSLETTKSLLPLPQGRVAVSESGLESLKEIQELHAAGVKAFLIGEAFLTSDNPEEKIASLLG